MADTNLYPPVIETTMPAFIRSSTCKVYFSLSKYNSLSDIANAQVVVRYQNTNTSALSSSLYPSGIKITDVLEDESITDDAKYYVEISIDDLTSEFFEINQYYKVQIRFTSTEAETVSSSIGIASWLTNNQDYFSEWSTVCLIRGIAQPYFTFTNFTDGTIFTNEFITLSGNMYFEDTSEKDYLVSYEVIVTQDSDSSTVVDSGIQYTEDYNPNEINYAMSYMFSSGSYKMTINYTTYCGYTGVLTYSFTVTVSTTGDITAEITITPDEENGRNIITADGLLYGTIILKRASSEDNFTVWETLDDSITVEEGSASSSGMVIYVNGTSLVISGADSVVINNVASATGYTHSVAIVTGDIISSADDDTLTIGVSISYTFYDYTIESGVWYKYAVQLVNSDGEYSNATTSDKMINVLDDIFLTRADMQLRVRFDPGISSFKRTYSEALTETIGSQYPYIRRNGAINYRQFPISGLITGFCDGEGIFINEDTLYGDNASDYAYYNEKMQIKKSKDFIYERKFREKIMDFLYANDVKLFRSTTEGNILVRLMDISFTPKSELGRMIYDFSATAYEIDDCSVENYQNYGIL